ncbi:MFS transporter [Bailinhaonella thermotolerans]|nr:MFS transporter [Bailinhaonella thermotolerans]
MRTTAGHSTTMAAGSGGHRLTLPVLCLSVIIIGLDNTALNVALPTMARDLNAGSQQLQWIIDAYTLLFAGLLLAAGTLGDRVGRKKTLALGLVVFAISSAAGAAASGPRELIAARAVMGVGAALIMPTTLSILMHTYRDKRARAKAVGVWSACTGLSVALGPTLGGWLLEHFSWGSVLLINVPIAVLALAAGHVLVPESKDPSPNRLDLIGAALSVCGLMTVVWTIIEAPEAGWLSARTLFAGGAGVTLLAVFVLWLRAAPAPLLDVSVFAKARFSAAAICISLAFLALFGSLFVISLYLQGVLGYDALESGVRLLPLAAGMAAGSAAATALGARLGEKIPALLGTAAMLAAFLTLATTTTSSGYGRLAVALVLGGVGMAMAQQTTTEAVMGALPLHRAGVGSAVNDTTRQVGGTLGIAVFGSLLHTVYSDHMTPHLGHLPPAAARAAQDTVIGADAAARALGGPAGRHLSEQASHAFVQALQTTGFLAAVIAVIAGVVVAGWLPAHEEDHA